MLAVPEDDLPENNQLSLGAQTEAEVLQANSEAMHFCTNGRFTDASEVLQSTLQRLQQDTSIPDRATIDRLIAATLINMGVVESRRGSHEQCLDHLEAAHEIEMRLGIQSPSTSLNLCAAHNALGEYERASQLALSAIAMLNARGEPNDDNKMLWGAAWHNLGVAQLNNTNASSATERAGVVLNIFRNAMRSTIDLLGPKHPMTIAVHESYRAVRTKLRGKGAFTLRESLPRISTAASTSRPKPPRLAFDEGVDPLADPKEATNRQLRLMSPPKTTRRRTNVPKQAVLNEDEELLASLPAYVALDGEGPPAPGSLRGKKRKTQAKQDMFHPTATLVGASRLYQCRQPVQQHVEGGPNSARLQSRGGQEQQRLPMIPQKPSSTRGSQKPRQTTAAIQEAPPTASYYQQPHQQQPVGRSGTARRLSELLLGDMWVELELPRNSPNSTTSNQHATTARTHKEATANAFQGTTAKNNESGSTTMRTAYSQPLYVIDPSDPVLENVSQPAAYAKLDAPMPPVDPAPTEKPPRPPTSEKQQRNSRQSHDSIPQRQGSETSIDTPTRRKHKRESPVEQLAGALGPNLSQYPNLQQFLSSQQGNDDEEGDEDARILL